MKGLIQIYENLWSEVFALQPHLKDETILSFLFFMNGSVMSEGERPA